MKCTHRVLQVLLTTALVAAAAPGAISEADKAAASQTVEKLFGAQIRQARMSLDKDDDFKTAQLLLQSSGEGGNALAVRAELARQAMELAISAGTEETWALAVEALRQWSSLAGLSRREHGQWLVNIRQAQLQRGRRDQQKPLTEQLVRAIVDLAEACEAGGDLDAAAAQILRATGLARQAQLTDLLEELNLTNLRIQHVRSFRRELEAAEQQLAAAKLAANDSLVQETLEKIALLHLLRNGDPISAAEHLANVKHPWAAQAEALRRRASGAKLTREEALAAAEMLHDAAGRATLTAKAPLLELLLDLCVELEADPDATAEQASRVQVLRKLAQNLLAQLPNSSLELTRRALAKLAGKVVFNSDGTVQVSYGFTSQRELNDWSVLSGQWVASKGALAVQRGGGAIYHNLRFRADRPLHLSFAAAGPGSITTVLALNDDLSNDRGNVHFCVGHQSGTMWYMGGLGGNRLIDRLPSNAQPYRVQILGDGTGSFALFVNGTALGKLQVRQSLVNASFRVGFVLSSSRVASYTNLVLRGTPLAKQAVAEAKGGQPPQAPQVPQGRPARIRRPPARRP